MCRSMKKNESSTVCYLPELERRICPKLDKVLNSNFPSLCLCEEEKNKVIQILKFLLSKNDEDAFVKRFDVNRTRKLLLSNDERLRQQGSLILQVLKELGRWGLAANIVKRMKMSVGVKELVLRAPLEFQTDYQTALDDILVTLDNSIEDLISIRKLIDKYNRIADIKFSQHGEAKDFIYRLSNNSRGIYTTNSPNANSYLFSIFIYPDDLERKLRNVSKTTWRQIVGKSTNQDIICFYIPSSSKTAVLSQEEHKFICKTLKEVLDKIKETRKKRIIKQ